jgi:hypothetical protein
MPHSNKELLLRGIQRGEVPDRLWFVSSARQGSLQYP